ncbi:hypothetical protein AVEN_34692-1 [Araneus ventricosus]|uniref:Uncharacterized protein n=1 Tax=Araneus ventricosus TaxID=182803 RepID=A0A4Y2B2H1_ARAVE|nr:hypothetical protein AVEN_34692-1 [Araneus ventricosus]
MSNTSTDEQHIPGKVADFNNLRPQLITVRKSSLNLREGRRLSSLPNPSKSHHRRRRQSHGSEALSAALRSFTNFRFVYAVAKDVRQFVWKLNG